MLAHEALEQCELRSIDSQADVGPAHVVDHDRRRQLGEEIPQLGQVDRLEVDHHMPAQLLDASRDLHQLVLGREIDQALDEVEANAANAGLVQCLQLGVADAALDGGHSACSAAAVDQRIDHRPVVCAVAGGLHHDVAGEPKVVAQGVELGLGRIARRVLALRRVREFGAWAKHMAVRVHAASRHLEARLARVGVPVEPAWGFVEIHAHRSLLPARATARARMRPTSP